MVGLPCIAAFMPIFGCDDAGPLVEHIPMPPTSCALLPVVLTGSASKGEFDAGSVKIGSSGYAVAGGQPRISLTYVARREELPRVFIPGIHANIPLALRIDRTHLVHYDGPPTLREQRKAAAQKGAGS